MRVALHHLEHYTVREHYTTSELVYHLAKWCNTTLETSCTAETRLTLQSKTRGKRKFSDDRRGEVTRDRETRAATRPLDRSAPISRLGTATPGPHVLASLLQPARGQPHHQQTSDIRVATDDDAGSSSLSLFCLSEAVAPHAQRRSPHHLRAIERILLKNTLTFSSHERKNRNDRPAYNLMTSITDRPTAYATPICNPQNSTQQISLHNLPHTIVTITQYREETMIQVIFGTSILLMARTLH